MDAGDERDWAAMMESECAASSLNRRSIFLLIIRGEGVENAFVILLSRRIRYPEYIQ